MPSKKRKYNARFPAGRIKKIMQTDEEVGKVAQAVPIIIFHSTPRTLELFVESLLGKAMQVTAARNAKTLSPSHVKQCILAESRFDFLKDLVKNIPDVSAAEEKELMSAESSPNSSRFSDTSAPPRRIARQDSNSSSSSDVKVQQVVPPRENLMRAHSSDSEILRPQAPPADTAIDLSRRPEDGKPVRTANFYQETLVDDHPSVITVNPTYLSPQPSTSSYVSLNPVDVAHKVENPPQALKPDRPPFYAEIPPPKADAPAFADAKKEPRTPVTPILNIDFTKSLAKPEIKVLDTVVAITAKGDRNPKLQRQNSKKLELKKPEPKAIRPVDIDHLNSGNLQIDEDYDT